MPVVLFLLKYYSESVRIKIVGVHAMIGTWRSGVLHPLVALDPKKELSIHTEKEAAGDSEPVWALLRKKNPLLGIKCRFLGRPVQSLYRLSY